MTNSSECLDDIRDKMKQESKEYESQNPDKIPFSRLKNRKKVELQFEDGAVVLPTMDQLFLETKQGKLFWQWVDMKYQSMEKHYVYETYYDSAYIQLAALERMDPYGGEKITYKVAFHPMHGMDAGYTTSKHEYGKFLPMIHENSRKVLEKYHSVSA